MRSVVSIRRAALIDTVEVLVFFAALAQREPSYWALLRLGSKVDGVLTAAARAELDIAERGSWVRLLLLNKIK